MSKCAAQQPRSGAVCLDPAAALLRVSIERKLVILYALTPHLDIGYYYHNALLEQGHKGIKNSLLTRHAALCDVEGLSISANKIITQELQRDIAYSYLEDTN